MMINIPLDQIKEKISKKTGLSVAQIDEKIKAKLKTLSGLISEEGAAHIVANELHVKLFEPGEATQIKGIMPGMRNIDIAAKVIQKYELREYSNEKGQGKVASMLVGDESGTVRVTLWHKQADNINALSEGDIIKISGGYVRENNGRKEIHLSEMGKLAVNPQGVSIKPFAPKSYDRKKISQITEGDSSIEILATIVQVFDINFFEVCPQCGKRIRMRDDSFACQTHGPQKPEYNYVLNLYVDDSSDNIRVVLWREQIEQLLAMNRSQIMAFKQDPSSFEPVKTDLLGNMVIIAGRASKNQTFDRLELVASKIDKNPDPQEEAKLLEDAASPEPKELDIDKELLDIEDI